MEMTFSVTKDISTEDIAGLLCCAFEGGSNYWYCIDYDKSVKPPEIDPELKKGWGTFRHISWPMSKGGALCVLDASDDEEEEYTLDLNAIKRGLDIMSKKYPRHWGDFINQNDDAYTGDCFLQCCIFGEAIYG